MHGRVVIFQFIDKQDLNQNAHFSTDSQSLAALEWGLKRPLAERGVGVSAIQRFEPFGAIVSVL